MKNPKLKLLDWNVLQPLQGEPATEEPKITSTIKVETTITTLMPDGTTTTVSLEETTTIDENEGNF